MIIISEATKLILEKIANNVPSQKDFSNLNEFMNDEIKNIMKKEYIRCLYDI